MGFIKGGLALILEIVLLLSLLIGGFFLTLSFSLNHDVLLSNVDSIIKSMPAEDQINIQAVQSLGNDSFSYASVIDNFYYKNYDCNGIIDCYTKTESPLFFVSQQANGYYLSKFYLFLFISAVLVFSLFFLFDSKKNFLLVIGILLIIASLPFMKLSGFLSFFSSIEILSLSSILFTQSYKIFMLFFIFGVAILAWGVVLKIFGGLSFLGFLKIGGKKEKDEKEEEKKEEIEEKEEEIEEDEIKIKKLKKKAKS